MIGCVIGCSSEAASCEKPALLWCQLLAEMQEYSVAAVTAAGDLSAVKLARMLGR